MAQSLDGLDIPNSPRCTPQTYPVAQLYEFGGYSLETYQFYDYTETLTLAGARLWAPDGSSLCWWWDGMKYPTVQTRGGPPVGTDLNGNGVPDVMITMNPQHNGCEHDTYVIELGDEPRLLFRSESWPAIDPEGEGFRWCPIQVRSLDRPHVYNLITSDESFGSALDGDDVSCSPPNLPVVFAPGADGNYQVVDPDAADPLMYKGPFQRAYWENLGYYFTRYSKALGPESEHLDLGPRPTTTCALHAIAMIMLYMGEDRDLIRQTVAALDGENDADAVVLAALRRAASSRLVGER